MNLTDKIYIAGHTGLVGSAIYRKFLKKGYSNFVFTPFPEYDLIDQETVKSFFEKEKPKYVILAAAKVGGIVANNTYRAQFIYENLMIQNNIIHYSYLNNVNKLLFLGSSCIYPKLAPQPLKEEYLLTSELEYTNEPYAIAKIAGIKMCEAYNLQYGTNFISVMPTNLYGPNDNYDLEKSHVLPALIRKMHLGKCLEKNDWNSIRDDFNKRSIEGINGNASEQKILKLLAKYGITKSYDSTNVKVTLWGTGSPFREFLYVDDLAEACLFLIQHVDFDQLSEYHNNSKAEVKNTHINIGTGEDLTIKELSNMVREIVGYKGEIVWDSTKPDGTPKKLLDISKISKLGWNSKISISEGVEMVYKSIYGS